MRQAGGWVDPMRLISCRQSRSSTPGGAIALPTGQASDRGRRLDHVWSSPNLADDLAGIEVVREARGWRRPSDHVPVIARFSFG